MIAPSSSARSGGSSRTGRGARLISYVAAVSSVLACGNTERPTVIVSSPLRAVTSEGGGTAAIEVVVSAQPEADVTFSVTSSNEDAGTIVVSELRFTSENWLEPQVVVVTGVDDGSGTNTDGGATDYELVFGEAVSTDEDWTGIQPTAVKLRNLDNEVGFTIVEVENDEEIANSNQGWLLFEDGSPLVLGIRLGDEPYAPVEIGMNLYLAGTSLSPVTAAPYDENVSFEPFGQEGAVHHLDVTIEPANYEELHLVTIHPAEDGGTEDPNKSFDLGIGMSNDEAYAALALGLVADNLVPYQINNVDLDSANVTVSPTPIRVCEGMGAPFDIQLSFEPLSEFQVNLSLDDPSDTLTLSSSVLTFTPSGDLSQTVTITSVNNDKEGNETATLNLTVTGDAANQYVLAYSTNPPEPVPVTVIDDDRGTEQPNPVHGNQRGPIEVEQQFCAF